MTWNEGAEWNVKHYHLDLYQESEQERTRKAGWKGVAE